MLTQGEVSSYYDFETPGGEDVYSSIAGQIQGFLANYRQWMDGGPADLARIRIDLDAAEARLRAAPGSETTREALGDVERLRGQLGELEGQVSNWQSTWDTMARWLSSIGAAVGLGFLAIPIGLTIAVAVSAIAALAWVVTTWQSTRTESQTLLALADRVATGDLTAEQAKALYEASKADSGILGGWFSGLGTAGLVAAGILAWILLRR